MKLNSFLSRPYLVKVVVLLKLTSLNKHNNGIIMDIKLHYPIRVSILEPINLLYNYASVFLVFLFILRKPNTLNMFFLNIQNILLAVKYFYCFISKKLVCRENFFGNIERCNFLVYIKICNILGKTRYW